MTPRAGVALAPLTTFRTGGPARFFAEARSVEDLRFACAFARAERLPLLVLGGGSNVLVPDEGVEAVVVRPAMDDIEVREEGGRTLIVAGAAARWDDLVKEASSRGLWGIENLAAIPGSAGGAVAQNIGAYGAELSQAFAYAEVVDLARGSARRMSPEEARFAYRDSAFKHDPALCIVRVALALSPSGTPNLSYPDLARAKERGAALLAPAEVAEAVRAIRAQKFPPEEGTAGSFFKNPIVESAQAQALAESYPGLPLFAQPDGRTKVSLAWLLDHVLSMRGFAQARARLYEKQPLVLVASRGAASKDVEALAQEVEARVHAAFGITLTREVETFGARAEVFL